MTSHSRELDDFTAHFVFLITLYRVANHKFEREVRFLFSSHIYATKQHVLVMNIFMLIKWEREYWMKSQDRGTYIQLISVRTGTLWFIIWSFWSQENMFLWTLVLLFFILQCSRPLCCLCPPSNGCPRPQSSHWLAILGY